MNLLRPVVFIANSGKIDPEAIQNRSAVSHEATNAMHLKGALHFDKTTVVNQITWTPITRTMSKSTRPRRPDYLPGHYYHIYNRGADRVSIFREADNYIFVLRKMKKYCRELNLSPIAYCLMPNHYHFLIRQDSEQAAGLFPQRVFNSYTKAFNKRFKRTGTLFEGPYQVVHITEESHLLHLCRYIHANPVKDGLVKKLEDWPFSNYLEWIGLRPGTLVDREFVCDHFQTPELYKVFVLAYLSSEMI